MLLYTRIQFSFPVYYIYVEIYVISAWSHERARRAPIYVEIYVISAWSHERARRAPVSKSWQRNWQFNHCGIFHA